MFPQINQAMINLLKQKKALLESQLKPMGDRVKQMAGDFGQGYMSGPQDMRMNEQSTSAYNLANSLANAPTPLGAGDDLLKAMPLIAGMAGKSDDVLKMAKKMLTKTDVPKPQVGGEKFTFIRNTEKAPNMGARFGQDIEPSGKYMNVGDSKQISDQMDYFKKQGVKGYETGTVEFKKPLVVEWDGWKQKLSQKYGGLTGKDLSKAIAKDGYDGIVTMDKGVPSEVVSLRSSPLSQEVGKEMTLYRAGEPNLKKGVFATTSRTDAQQYADLSTRGSKVEPLVITSPRPDKVFTANSQFDAYVKLFPDSPKSEFIKHKFLGGSDELLNKFHNKTATGDDHEEWRYLEDMANKMTSRHKLFVDDGNYNFVATLDKQIRSELQKKGYQLVEYVKPSENGFRSTQRAKEYVVLDPSIIKTQSKGVKKYGR